MINYKAKQSSNYIILLCIQYNIYKYVYLIIIIITICISYRNVRFVGLKINSLL